MDLKCDGDGDGAGMGISDGASWESWNCRDSSGVEVLRCWCVEREDGGRVSGGGSLEVATV